MPRRKPRIRFFPLFFCLEPGGFLLEGTSQREAAFFLGILDYVDVQISRHFDTRGFVFDRFYQKGPCLFQMHCELGHKEDGPPKRSSYFPLRTEALGT